jgi:hypothetical protein
MLDIDATGVVQHVKMINRPGYGLDDIAIRDAFKLEFEPARDRANRPVPSMLLWTYEWPSYSWLSKHHKNLTVLPADALEVTCQTEGMPRVLFRDCTQADVRGALDEAWIAPKPSSHP